ncbi:MAG TPA: flagellar assembly protein FliH [Steroidobacteraceae bacterium]|nr:flagellar assembly protein FliH [Steroidobacteraceae bacterium]
MSSSITKADAAKAELWSAPEMGQAAPRPGVPAGGTLGAPGAPDAARPASGQRVPMPTVSGLADLQAEAYQEAFEQGLAEGREAGRAQVRAQVEKLEGMFYDLAKPFEALDAEVERELLTLAMALARQIVRRELKADPSQIIGIVREAIAVLPVAAREVRVHLHPEDAAVVRQNLAPTESERAWQIVEDPVMARGGCQVTTSTSRVDVRLETRLGAILSELMGTERQSDPRGAGA